MKNAFSTEWKRSIQTRKQRKYKIHAPLHVRQKFMHVHLSAELRKKYARRSVQIRKEDKVSVMRGIFKGKTGKVESVDIKKMLIFISGIETIKKEGSKVPYGITPSNLVITELYLDDKKRKLKVKNDKATSKTD